MALFEYIARDMTGKKLTGRVESASRSLVIDELLGRKAIPISIKKLRSMSDILPGRKIKLKREELIIFTRQLLTMLKAGIGILSCLDSLKSQADNPEMKKLVYQMFRDVSAGKSLSEAMAQHPGVFSDVYVSTVRVGEEGGVLDEVLGRLVYLLEHELETRAALKQATRYPLMVLAGLVVSFLVAIFFVLPKFSQMYSRFEADLPLPTRILLQFNDAIHNNLIPIFIGFLLLIGTLVWLSRTEQGKRTWDRYKLAMPVVGPLFVRIAVTRFARMFATLDRCGLPILRNLEIVAESVGNIVIAKEIMYQRDCIRQGKTIAEPLKESKYFPPLVTEMLSIGEASGSMEEVLSAVSDHYDREINYAVKNMTTLIEPMITVLMGAFVLFMAVAVFLPMWKLSSVIKK